MVLTQQQLQTLKAAIDAETDSAFVSLRDIGSTQGIADWYNNNASTFVVWKTSLTEHEITSLVSNEETTWNWSDYIGRSVAERDAWGRMFNGTYTINPSLPQVRAGIADIFSGAPGAAQRAHLLAMGKRTATLGEAIFAIGTGTEGSPGNLTFEGDIQRTDVASALALA